MTSACLWCWLQMRVFLKGYAKRGLLIEANSFHGRIIFNHETVLEILVVGFFLFYIYISKIWHWTIGVFKGFQSPTWLIRVIPSEIIMGHLHKCYGPNSLVCVFPLWNLRQCWNMNISKPIKDNVHWSSLIRWSTLDNGKVIVFRLTCFQWKLYI